MPAANESQGLKIAVAAFVSLTVILAVTSYFLYSNYDQTAAKLVAAEEKARTAQKAQNELVTQNEEFKKQIGSRAEEYDAVKTEMKNAEKKINDEIGAIGPAVVEMVSKVQAAGGTSPALEEVKTNAQTLVGSYQGEPNKTYISSLARLTDMLKNQVRLTTTLAMSYVELKNSLESVNTVNKQQLDVVEKARGEAKTDVESEQKKHVEERGVLLTKVDQQQTEINNNKTEIATLQTKIRTLTESSNKRISDLLNQIREHRDAQAQKETVLDRPDGTVTFVDYNRFEVRTNITYSMGARPQMHLTIFDRNSPGIPTEKPKGTIELTYVGDRYSIGKMIGSETGAGGDAQGISRVVQMSNPTDPIRVGDIVYSPAWSPNEPMRFALIGKMDVNRDGKDDRADLIRMIESAGGIVDYDLPPPYVGKERGKLTGRDAWYVVDERPPLRNYENRGEDLGTPENAEFLKKRSASIREARDNGVRPMRLERLLSYLGYDYAAAIKGRVEAVDTQALKSLGRPRTDAPKTKPATPEPNQESATTKEEKPEDEATPKTEKPEDEPAPKEEKPEPEDAGDMPKDAPK